MIIENQNDVTSTFASSGTAGVSGTSMASSFRPDGFSGDPNPFGSETIKLDGPGGQSLSFISYTHNTGTLSAGQWTLTADTGLVGPNNQPQHWFDFTLTVPEPSCVVLLAPADNMDDRFDNTCRTPANGAIAAADTATAPFRLRPALK
jgi:hypothetical protein